VRCRRGRGGNRGKFAAIAFLFGVWRWLLLLSFFSHSSLNPAGGRLSSSSTHRTPVPNIDDGVPSFPGSELGNCEHNLCRAPLPDLRAMMMSLWRELEMRRVSSALTETAKKEGQEDWQRVYAQTFVRYSFLFALAFSMNVRTCTKKGITLATVRTGESSLIS